jgi:pimeloyl-ACP methyl ester carboxylesterase
VLEDAAPFLLKRLPPVTRAVGYAPRVTRGLLGWYLLNRRVALHGLSQIFGRVSPTHHARVDVFFKHTRVKGSMDALVAMLGSPMDDDLPEVIADITVPSLIVWGERDRVVPLSHGRRLRQLLPNSKLAIVESAGHIPHEEFPDQVNELLLEFL